MFDHRGVKITVTETNDFEQGQTRLFTTSGKMFYVAQSKYGISVDANSPDQALDGAREQINQALNG